MDRRELCQVQVHVEGEAVPRAPATARNAEAGDLAILHPHPGASGTPDAVHLEGADRADDQLLEVAEVRVQVSAPFLEQSDHVAHELTRSVERHVASALTGDDRDAVAEDVRGIRAAPERDDRGVFQEQQGIGDVAEHPGVEELELPGMCFFVGHEPQIEDFERHAGPRRLRRGAPPPRGYAEDNMSATDRRHGNAYRVLPEEVEAFQVEGYVHLRGVLSEAEMAEIEAVYDRFLRRDIEVPGRDLCDMSGDYGRAFEDFSIVNVMLPRRYYPAWQGNLYELRAASIAEQLIGSDLAIDYDQLLAKRPHKEDAVFAWHQDMAYWPDTTDPRTASFWLAVDDSTVENGCMRFVPRSHQESALRPHRPLHDDRSESHSLVTDVDPVVDEVRDVPIRRGDVTVHNERVVHGSGPNLSDGWRRAYIVSYRSRITVEEERARGFTHSHNDEQDVLEDVGVDGETR